ncbi:molybdopterin-binding protein [Legionella sp. PC997]|uniref:competence/damage-inducible protein A n=1 Tax=Legionella sp. PC997 TaxID=2755562 RepID=UPI0015F7FDA9|nr:competence/damage-inducible protein A [Legionella sp. PC997]QMT61156.1 competence/damage-inducible protein A [Legionella sp. PC997]
MTVAILATGDEIVHGDTLNTNGRDIAHALSSEGLSLGLHLSCSDKKGDIVNCLKFLTKKHDIIITIGGLGPTTDDLTRFALSQFTGEALVQHSEALEHIKKRLRDANLILNAGNLQQCLFPERAQLLPNPVGSALGCYYQWDNKIFFLLPGPPRECLPMFNNYALPLLQQTTHSQKQILKWRIFGLAESEIAQILEEALQGVDCHTGYRWESPYIEFKVRCAPNLMDKIKAIVNPILEPHIISSVEKKASDHLRELIASINEPITIIDEATGGLLQLLLSKPNIHHLLHFSGLHQNMLYFHIRGLTEYWQQQPTNGTTQLIIDYSNHYQKGRETHNIPYRNVSVVEHAAEWLCCRLFHLINQLHQ